MDGKQCTKRHPRKCVKETQTNQDGYPAYRRRSKEDGAFTTVVIDNRWVVSYNPVLLHAFDAHINVEACHSVKSIKYALDH